ncbi:MAG: carbohydrate binding family 9 domain-containing protein, partial [Candidatus Aminicenantes bacterium]|nr:carbohydrate binding family 9 domain-containing protein [Candidatus Aminicenantes bacterium]
MRNEERREKRVLTAILLSATVLFAGLLLAGAQPQAKPPLDIPRLSHAPKIDGVLDNPIWEKEALKIEDFVQLTPKENGPPTEKTVAYVGYDEKNLYLAFRCFDSDPAKVRCSITSRDNIIDDDWILLMLDTFNEKRRAFGFFLNPAGIQIDAMRTEEGGSDNFDLSWDTVFDSAGTIDKDGWTAEIAVPFKSIRFPDQETKSWNIVLARNLPRKGEIILWPSYSRDVPGLLSQGRIWRIQGRVEKGKNLEVMPILTSLQRQGESLNVQPGANVKYGVSSNMTLDFAANPDFSHIEADAPQIDVNLRYALRYQEKRPFFMEGMELFSYPQIEMVYTRRIIDPLWGAKISGKFGKTAYGILSAYDVNPSESLWDVHSVGANKNESALFNIVRLKTDVGAGSFLGFSLADKEIDGSWNRVAGLDGQLRFKDRVFVFFQAVASKTSDDGEITALAPALYAESYYTTKHWTAGGYFMAIHPAFEVSSGFINRTDYRSGGLFSSLTLYPDKKFLNQVRFQLQAGQRDSYFGSTVQDQWGRFNLQLRFTEFNQMFITLERAMERYADIDFRKTNLSVESQFNLIGWMPLSFFFETGGSINYDPEDAFLGYSNAYGVSVNFKPSKRLNLGFDLSKQTFWEKAGGKELWDYNVVRMRTT